MSNSPFYRKIWERHNGPIPTGYEIHHIDGDPKNNDISNLLLVTIQEHYDIHYSQHDWGACSLIADRMNIDPKVKSELCRKVAIKRNKAQLEAGTHNFLGKVSCVDEQGNSYFVSKEEFRRGGHYHNRSKEACRRKAQVEFV